MSILLAQDPQPSTSGFFPGKNFTCWAPVKKSVEELLRKKGEWGKTFQLNISEVLIWVAKGGQKILIYLRKICCFYQSYKGNLYFGYILVFLGDKWSWDRNTYHDVVGAKL